MFSGLAPIADMRDGVPDFRLVPIATERSAANPCLFDHLVGGDEQARRHRQAECLRSFEI